MRSGVVLLTAVFALVAAPALVGAQALPGLPGLFPGLGGAGCGADPKASILGAPSGYIGYVGNMGDTRFALDATNLGASRIDSISTRWRNEGLWLELALPLRFGPAGALVLSGSYMVPSQTTAYEQYNRYTSAAVIYRDWSTSTDWFTAQVLWAYPCGETFAFVAGLRWDSFQVAYSSPTAATGFLGTTNDSADLKINVYEPFVGGVMSWVYADSALTVGAVGMFTTLGDIKYREGLSQVGVPISVEVSGGFQGGHFIEAWAEYTRKMFGNASWGGFAKVSSLQARSHLTLDLNANAPGLGLFTQEYDSSFTRNVWIVGGKVAVDLGLPF
ncbi:MAG: hypothetical protein FJ118_02730 [Deltaproteobacteria bacterium]|nr:hypothetical protein [Deltaproteobacteria bacterium]